MGLPILKELAVLFGLAVLALLASYRLRLPAVLGFFLTGILIGPHGFGWIQAPHQVEVLAEIGIVLLLFVIGLEFSFREIFRLRREFLVGGSGQVGLTVGAILLLSIAAGETLPRSVFAGFLLSLSSTAIVLKALQEQREIDAPHGRASLAVLIFQDMAVVLMMLVVPVLSGGGLATMETVPMIQSIALVVLGVFPARWAIPRLLGAVARTRNRELFLLAICAIGAGVGALAGIVGLSVGLGAFLAGLLIAETDYGLEAAGGLTPFRDVFASLFFISIGMLLDLSLFVQMPVRLLELAGGLMMLKAILMLLVGWWLRLTFRTAFITALTLAQVGEFSFVLAGQGLKAGLLDLHIYQIFLAVSVLTMAAAPFLIRWAPFWADRLGRFPMTDLRRFKSRSSETAREPDWNDHLIVVGFGLAGRMLAQVARMEGFPYVVLETNPETVQRERAEGHAIHFGNATRPEVLSHVGVARARAAVVVISDHRATLMAVKALKASNPNLPVLARVRYVLEIDEARWHGADAVICAESETAVAIHAWVAHQLGLSVRNLEGILDGLGRREARANQLAP